MQTDDATFPGDETHPTSRKTLNMPVAPPDSLSLERGEPPVQEFDDLSDVDAVSSENAPHAWEIPDRLDEVLIVTLPARRWEVEPGDVVALPVTVFNNSRRKLSAHVYVEGWLDERWMVEPYVQATLEPGERITLELNLSPPRHVGTEAGDHPLAVVVRSPEEPLRMVRLGFTLRVLPFKRLALEVRGMPGPAAWWRHRARRFRAPEQSGQLPAHRAFGRVDDDAGRFASPSRRRDVYSAAGKTPPCAVAPDSSPPALDRFAQSRIAFHRARML